MCMVCILVTCQIFNACVPCDILQGTSSGGVSGAEGEHSSQKSRLCLPQRIWQIPQTVSPAMYTQSASVFFQNMVNGGQVKKRGNSKLCVLYSHVYMDLQGGDRGGGRFLSRGTYPPCHITYGKYMVHFQYSCRQYRATNSTLQLYCSINSWFWLDQFFWNSFSALSQWLYIFTPLKVLHPDSWDLPSLEWNSDRGNQTSDAGCQHGTRPMAARQDQGLYQESRISEWVSTF